MPIFRVNHTKDQYTPILNSVLQSKLSFEARGVLVYLLSKPMNWVVRLSDIQRVGNIGRDKAQRIMKELESNGYAKLQCVKDKHGKISSKSYWIYEGKLPSPSN